MRRRLRGSARMRGVTRLPARLRRRPAPRRQSGAQARGARPIRRGRGGPGSRGGWRRGWRSSAAARDQDRRGLEAQRPAEGPQYPGHRRGCCFQQRRHRGVAQQVVELRAVRYRFRHQREQPAECSRQAAASPGLSGRLRAPWGVTARAIGSGPQPGGETGEILADGSYPAQDQPEDRGRERAEEALGCDRPAQPLQDGREAFGGEAGGRGHGVLLVFMTYPGQENTPPRLGGRLGHARRALQPATPHRTTPAPTQGPCP